MEGHEYWNSDDDALSLELYLDDNSYTLCSIGSSGEPYFEVESAYVNQSEQMLKAIENCEMDDQLIRMFDGIDERYLDMGVHCIITDKRKKDHSCDRCIILRRRCDLKSVSSDDSEMSMSFESDECSQ